MFLSSILQTIQTLLSESHSLRDFPVQLTPDERPFPRTGDKSITMFASEFSRVGITDNRKYQSTIKLSINSRVTSAPRDRQYNILYTNTLVSLSTICDIVLSILDSNNNILSLINTQVNTNKNIIINDLSTSPNDEVSYINSLNNAGVIGPIRVLGYTAQPIPRFDDFFTAYSEKRDVPFQEGNGRITESGYSMVITLQGPIVILPTIC